MRLQHPTAVCLLTDCGPSCIHCADHSDVVVFCNTIGFDAHIIQGFPPLTVGATLVVAKPEGHVDPQYIASLIRRHAVTGMICTVPTLVSGADLPRCPVHAGNTLDCGAPCRPTSM